MVDITRQDLDNSEDEKLESGDIGGSYYKANQISKNSHNIDNEFDEDDMVSNNPNSSMSKVGAPPKHKTSNEESKEILDLP